MASAPELRAQRAGAYELARPDVQAHVPRSARRILDLGCSSGALGEALKSRQGSRVVGVEIDPAYAEDAGRRLDLVLCENLDVLAGDPARIEALGRFDCIVAADVLEHVVDPWLLLRTVCSRLDAGGTVVVSIPNIRYWETTWQLNVRGRWPRRDFGLFDRTHLRWFTLRDARDLLEQAGLCVIEVEPKNRLVPRGSRLDRHAWGSSRVGRLVHPVFAYQYLLVGVRPDCAGEVDP